MAGLSTNFNVAPFYDDYDPNNQYYRILFRPGTAVQARELTQLQTILQNQVSSFGNSIYKDGSVIEGCNFTTYPNMQQIKFVDSNSSTLDFTTLTLNYTDVAFDTSNNIVNASNSFLLVSNTSGLRASVFRAYYGAQSQAPYSNRAYVQYLNVGNNSSTTFSQTSEQIDVYSGNQSKQGPLNPANKLGVIYTLTSNSTVNALATGYGMHVGPGIIYQKGFFIESMPDNFIISEHVSNQNGIVVGFDTSEEIITPYDDTSLFDNSQGSSNYSAPGAYRLKLVPRPVFYDSSNTAVSVPNNFLVIVKFDTGTGQVILNKSTPQLSTLGDTIATQQLETAGNFIVTPFTVNVVPSANNETFLYSISSGTAYVDGYRVQTLGTSTVEVPRGIFTKSINQDVLSLSLGNYYIVNEVAGTPDVQGLEEVILYDAPRTALSLPPVFQPAGRQIGTANIRAFKYYQGTKGTPEAQYKMYLCNIQLTGNPANIRSLYAYSSTYGAFYADIVLDSLKGIAIIQEPTLSLPIYDTGVSGLDSLVSNAGMNNTSFYYRPTLQASLTQTMTGATANFTVPGPDIFSYGDGFLDDSTSLDVNITFAQDTFTQPLMTDGAIPSSTLITDGTVLNNTIINNGVVLNSTLITNGSIPENVLISNATITSYSLVNNAVINAGATGVITANAAVLTGTFTTTGTISGNTINSAREFLDDIPTAEVSAGYHVIVANTTGATSYNKITRVNSSRSITLDSTPSVTGPAGTISVSYDPTWLYTTPTVASQNQGLSTYAKSLIVAANPPSSSPTVGTYVVLSNTTVSYGTTITGVETFTPGASTANGFAIHLANNASKNIVGYSTSYSAWNINLVQDPRVITSVTPFTSGLSAGQTILISNTSSSYFNDTISSVVNSTALILTTASPVYGASLSASINGNTVVTSPTYFTQNFQQGSSIILSNTTGGFSYNIVKSVPSPNSIILTAPSTVSGNGNISVGINGSTLTSPSSFTSTLVQGEVVTVANSTGGVSYSTISTINSSNSVTFTTPPSISGSNGTIVLKASSTTLTSPTSFTGSPNNLQIGQPILVANSSSDYSKHSYSYIASINSANSITLQSVPGAVGTNIKVGIVGQTITSPTQFTTPLTVGTVLYVSNTTGSTPFQTKVSSINSANSITVADIPAVFGTSIALTTGGSYLVSASNPTFSSTLYPGASLQLTDSTGTSVPVTISSTNATSVSFVTTPNVLGSSLTVQQFFKQGEAINLTGSGNTISQDSTTSMTMNICTALDVNTYNVYGQIPLFRSNANPTGKVVNKGQYVIINCGSNLGGTTGPWALGISDVFGVANVYVGSTANTNNPDYGTWFSVDNGQRDAFYGNAKLSLLPSHNGALTNTSVLLVKLNCFTPNTTATQAGFYSVDSYPIDDVNTANLYAIATAQIPIYTSVSGVSYDLRNFIDTRPVMANTAVITNNVNLATQDPALNNGTKNGSWISSGYNIIPDPDSKFNYSATYYLPRFDNLILTSGSQFIARMGASAEHPQPPTLNKTGLNLAQIYVPPYPSLTFSEAQ